MKKFIPALVLPATLLSACSPSQDQDTANESNTTVSTSLEESEETTRASHSSQADPPDQAMEDQESSEEVDSIQEYSGEAVEVDYESLLANPDKYLDQLVYVEGSVEDIQTLEDYTRFYLNDGQGRIDVEFETSNLKSDLEEGNQIGLEGVFIGLNQDQMSGEPLDPIVAGQAIK